MKWLKIPHRSKIKKFLLNTRFFFFYQTSIESYRLLELYFQFSWRITLNTSKSPAIESLINTQKTAARGRELKKRIFTTSAHVCMFLCYKWMKLSAKRINEMREMMLALTDQEGRVGMNESWSSGSSSTSETSLLKFQLDNKHRDIFRARGRRSVSFAVFRANNRRRAGAQGKKVIAIVIDFLCSSVSALESRPKKKPSSRSFVGERDVNNDCTVTQRFRRVINVTCKIRAIAREYIFSKSRVPLPL